METVEENAEHVEMENTADSSGTSQNDSNTGLTTSVPSGTSSVVGTNMDASEMAQGTESAALITGTDNEDTLLQQTEQGLTNAGFQTETGLVPSEEEVIDVNSEEQLTDVVVIPGDSKTGDNAQSELTSEDSSLIQEAVKLGKHCC